MARKIVAVHCMHEHERSAARQVLQHPEEGGDAFVLGELDAKGIEALRQQGLVVEELGDVPDEPAPAAPSQLFAFLGGDALLSAPSGPARLEQRYILTLTGPLLPRWRTALEGLGLTLEERVGHFDFEAAGPTGLTARLQALDFVRQVKVKARRAPLSFSTHPLRPTLDLPFLGGGPREEDATLTGQEQLIDIILKSESQASAFKQWLAEAHVELIAASKDKVRIRLSPSRREEVLNHPSVATHEEYLPPELYNDLARGLLGLDPPPAQPPPPPLFPWTGKGQLVAVADSGLDVTHPDLRERIHKLFALGREDDASDPSGHGTHVAGSIVGTGAASGGSIRGVAPDARLVFQSLLDARDTLGGLPLKLEDLFEQAYQEGARIHNDSWGSDAQARYMFSSREVDAYVAGHRDMLVVIAAGNAGTAVNPVHSPNGVVDLQSIGAPATCKNGLVVGASRSPRTEGGRARRTYCEFWDTRFSQPPIATQFISGDPECLAAFSSRGACHGNRIKPDLVAPGTDILSTRSSKAPLYNFWAPYPGNNHYAYLGGTSMAAPLVSGCAALVREYYASLSHEPSAALVKATLINGTRWLRGQDALADGEVPPNNDQGFGRVSMLTTLPSPAEPRLKLAFIDCWKQPAQQLPATNTRRRFAVTVKAGVPLRICLAYMDPPANGLQNVLYLQAEAPDGRKWLGNGRLSAQGHPLPDHDNNVSVIRMEEPVAGRYLLQVSAWNILHPAQDYALVVTGDLESALDPA